MQRKQKSLIAILTFVLIMLTTYAYSALATNLSITGEANFRVPADIRVTNILMSEQTGSTLEYEPKFTKDTITTGFTLSNTSSNISYSVTIKNNGLQDYAIYDFVTQSSNNSGLIILIDGKQINQALPIVVPFGTTKTITITYSSSTPGRVDVTNKFDFRKIYYVDYNLQGGSSTDDDLNNNHDLAGRSYGQIKYENVNLTLSNSEPTKVGYQFIGWNTQANGQGTNYTKGSTYTPNENKTLYAKWQEKTLTITLDNQDATTPGTATIYEKYNTGIYKTNTSGTLSNQMTTSANPITKPEKDGYKFGGYYTEANGQGIQYINENGYLTQNATTTQFKNNGTLYAKWTAYKLTINYYANGAQKDNNVNIQNQKLTTDTYDYDGEDLKTNGLKNYDGGTGATWNLTKTGYSADKYWHVGSGSASKKVHENTKFDKIQDLAIAMDKIDDFKTGDVEVNIYAGWTANNYKVRFNKNDSNATGVMSDEDFTYDASAKALTKNIFTRTGYTFTGWNTQANGQGTAYTDEQSVQNLTAEKDGIFNLYAQWVANTYTAYYYDSGSWSTMGSKTITYGQTYGTLTEPTKTGYTFDGWYNTVNKNVLRISSTQDTFRYARVARLMPGKTYSISIGDAKVTEGTAEGYTILCHNVTKATACYNQSKPFNTSSSFNFTTPNDWSDSDEIYMLIYTGIAGHTNGVATEFSNITISYETEKEYTSSTVVDTTSNVVLTAHWTPNDYTVTFDPTTGGSVSPTSKTVTYDSTYGNLPEPNKTGYTFTGWAGKNLFDEDKYKNLDNYTFMDSPYKVAKIYLKASTTYKISITKLNGFDGKNKGTLLLKSDLNHIYNGNYTAVAHNTVGTYSNNNFLITTGSDGIIYIGYGYDQSNLNYIFDNTDIMIEEGSTATSYEPYQVITSSSIVKTASNHTLTAQYSVNELTFNNQTGSTTYNASNIGSVDIVPASNGTGSYTYTKVSEKKGTTNTNNFSITNNNKITAKANTPAGTYTIVVKATDDNSGATKEATYTITVNRQNVTVPTCASFTYNKTTQTLIESTTKYTASNNTGLNADDYTVTVTPTSNYKWSDGTTTGKSVSCTINPYDISGANSTIVPIASDIYTYDGSAKTPEPSVMVPLPTSSDSYTLTSTEIGYTYSNNTSAGTATVTATGTGNYTGTKSESFTINKATGYVTLDKVEENKEYSTTSATFNVLTHSGDLEVSDNNATATVSILGTQVTVSNISTLASGTEVVVTVTSKANTNYTVATETYTLRITDKPITGGSVIVTGNNIVGSTLTASVTNTTPVGTYTYQWYRGDTPINNATSSTYTVTSSDVASTLKVVVTSSKTNYSSISFEDTTDATNNKTEKAKTGVTKPTTAKCTNPTYNAESQVLTTSASTGYAFYDNSGVDAGSYTVTAKLSNNYIWSNGDTTDVTFDCSIEQRAITVKASNQSKTYSGTALSANSTCELTSGTLAGSHSLSCTASGSITDYASSGATKTLNTAKVMDNTTDVSSNYNITKQNGTLTIKKKSITITAKAQTVQYGTAISKTTSDVTVATLASTDSLNSITLTQDKTEVSTDGKITASGAVIKRGTTTATGNYKITYNQGDLTITKKDISAVIGSCSDKQYDRTTNATCGITPTDIETGETVSVLGTCAFDNKNVGTDKEITCSSLTLSGTNADNYNLTTESLTGSADITAKPITPTATASNKVYNGNATATCTISLPGVISGDTVNKTYTGTFNNKNVGTGKAVTCSSITLTGTDKDNYSLTTNSINTTANITAKEVAVTWTNAGPFTYNGNEQGPTATVNTGITGETMSVNATKATVKGTHTSTATCESVTGSSACGNYTLTGNTKEFTINAQTVNPVTNLTVTPEGIVSWTASSNATGYQISIDGTNWTNIPSDTTSYNYFDVIKASATSRTVHVRAINSDTDNYSTVDSGDSYAHSSDTTQTVTVYHIDVNVNNTNYGTVNNYSLAGYNLIAGTTYTTSGNVLTFSAGNYTVTARPIELTGYTTTFTSWSSTSGTINSNTSISIANFTRIANTYTVTANSNNGSIASTTGWTGTGNTSTKSVTYDSAYGTLPTVSRNGYTLKGWSLLPEGYKQVEYIESTGTQYIDTGYYWTHENIGIYFDGKVLTNASDQSLFGNEEYITSSGTSRNFAGVAHGRNGAYSIWIGNGSQGSVTTTLETRFNLNIITTSNKYLYVSTNNEKSFVKTYSGSVLTHDTVYKASTVSTTMGNMFIFANHNTQRGYSNASTQNVSSMQLYAFKMIDNGEIVRDFVPCVQESTGKAGLYDTVNGVFYGNANTSDYDFTVPSEEYFITSETIVKTSENHDIYAHWTPVTYNITYDLRNGSASNPSTYNIETNTFSLNNPTRSGYTFSGWTGSNGNTPQTSVSITKGSTGDKSFTANWSKAASSLNVTLGTSSYTYNGSAKEPTVTVKDGTTTIPSSEYDVTYSNNTNAGTATVTVTMKGNYYASTKATYTGSTTTNFTINRAGISLPTCEATYDKTEQTLLSSTTTYTVENSPLKKTAAGTYKVNVTPTSNYKWSSDNTTTAKEVSCVINQRELDQSKFTTGNTSKTYNGNTNSSITLTANTNSGLISGDSVTVSYTSAAYNNANVASASSINVTGITLSNANYKVKNTTQSYSGTITRANVAFPSCSAVTYNKSEQTLFEAHSGNYSNSVLKATNAGTYQVALTPDANHKWTDNNSTTARNLSCTINKYNISSATVSTIPNHTYDNTVYKPTPSVTVPLPSSTNTYTLTDSEYDYSYSAENPTDVAEYTVTMTAKADTSTFTNNYTGSVSKKYNIVQANGYVNLSANSGSVTYGTTSKTFTVSSSHGGTLSVTDNRTTPNTTITNGTVTVNGLGSLASGTQVTVTVTSAATTNYKAASATYVLTVTNAPIDCGTVTITGNDVVGEALTASTTSTPSDVTKSYQWYTNTSDSTSGGSLINGATSNEFTLTSSQVGKYIYATITCSKTNYTTSSASGKTTTSANKTATVKTKVAKPTTAKCENPTYNGSSQTITKTADTGYAFSNNSATNYNADGYTVTAALSTNYIWSDYTTANHTINCNITRRPVTYKADDASKTYNGTALTKASATLTDGTLVSGHTATFSITGTQTNAGSSTNTLNSVTITDGSSNNVTANYNITKQNGTLTVNRANATCTINSTPTLTYPGSATGNITYTCTGDGTRSVTSSDTNAITVGTVGTTSTPLTAKKVGSSTISVSQAQGTNYNAATAVSSTVSATGTIYTITLNQQNGTGGTSSTNATYGSSLPNITIPTKTGYTFKGYYTNTDAHDLDGTVSSLSSVSQRISFDNNKGKYNDWAMTIEGDTGRHVQGIINVTDSSVTSKPVLDFNDLGLISYTKSEHTGDTWKLYFDFDLTSEMVGDGRQSYFVSTYRFIDVNNIKDTSTVTIDYLTIDGKKYYDASGKGTIPSDFTSNTTLYAGWRPNDYTVTANANGGTIASTTGWTGTGDTATKSVTYDSTYGTLPTVSRTGYNLNGWYRLPSNFESLDYLEFNGSQYIDTKVLTKQSLRIESEFSSTSANKVFFGARTDTATNAIVFGYFGTNTSFVGFGGSTANASTTINPMDGNKHRVLLSNTSYQLDGANQTILNRSTLSSFYNIYLGSWNNGGTADSRMFAGKVYNFIVYDDNTLVRYMVPCKDKTNNKEGLYDFVEQKFYTFGSNPTSYTDDAITSSTTVKNASDHNIYAVWTPNELTFNNQTLNAGTYGTAYTSNAFTTASNGTESYTYTIVSGQPTGATINSTNRTISFTNTTAAGTYNVKVRATDNNSGMTKDATMTIVINRQAVAFPSCSAKTYNGTEQTLFDAHSSGAYTNSVLKGTNATTSTNTYSVSLTPTSNYQWSSGSNTTSARSLTCTINPKQLDVTKFTVNNGSKTYDKSTDVKSGFGLTANTTSGLVSGDSVTVSYSSASYNVATTAATTINVSGISINNTNYSLSSTSNGYTGSITAKTLTATVSANNKTYDRTTDATCSSSVSLSGVISGDTVTASANTAGTFDNKNVGTGKTVTCSGITLSGTDKGNYTVASSKTTTANITAKTLTPTVSANNKTYDRTTDATCSSSVTLSGVVSGDTVTASANTAGAFDNKNVGTGKTVTCSGITLAGTDKGNYSVVSSKTTTANITAKALTPTVSANNKTYDGTTDATCSSSVSLSGVISGDTVTASASTSGIFDNKNVGTGKTVTCSGITLAGTDKGNYSVVSSKTTTANITAKTLTVTAADKTKKYSAANPTLTYTYTGNVGSETPGFEGELATAATVNSVVGSYDITQGTLALKDGTNGFVASNYTMSFTKGTLTVNKADNPISVTATQSWSPTYNASSAQDRTFTAASNAQGDVTYTIASQKQGSTNVTYFSIGTASTNKITMAKETPVGTYTVKITASAAGNSNYSSGSKEITLTVTVGKAACTLSVTNGSMNTGTNMTLSQRASGNKGTLSYALKTNGRNTTTASTISSGTLTAGAMSTSDDNDQYVDVTITDAGSSNYEGCSKDVVITVSKYTRTLSWTETTPAASSTLTYGNSYTATVTPSGTGGTQGAITYASNNTSGATIDSSTGAISVVNGNSKAVKITATMARTSTVKEATIERSFTTGKHSNSITLTCASLTYNKADQNLLSNKTATGGSVYIAKESLTASNYSTKGSTNLSGAQGQNAGSYTVYAYTPGNDNYSAASTSKSCSIAKYNISSATVSTISNHTYDGNVYKPTPSVTVPLPNSTNTYTLTDSEYSYSYSTTSPTDVAEYTVTMTAKADTSTFTNNYTGSVSKKYNIVQANGYVNLSANSGSVTYGTTSKTFTVSSSHGGTLSVTDNRTTPNTTITNGTVTINGLGSLASGTQVTVTVTSAATTNYKQATATYVLTVTNASIDCGTVTISGNNVVGEKLTASNTATPSDVTKTYQWYTNTSDSTTGGSSINGATSNEYTLTSSEVGKYIYATITCNKTNYTTATASGKATTSANKTATTKTKVTKPTTAKCNNPTYTGSPVTLTKTADTGYAFTNNSATTYINPNPVSGKSNYIYVVTASLSTNYIWSDYTTANTTIDCSITRKAVGYTATNQSKTYDGTALNADATCSKSSGALVSGHSATCSNSGSQTNAGSSTKTLNSVTITDSSNNDVSSNYNISKTNGTLTVNKANATCTINTTPTLVYPDTATGNITYTCTGDGTISVASSDTNAITVGTVGTTSTPLTAKKVGSSTISVSQAEGANYNAAPAVSSAVNVTGSTYTATFKYYDGTEVATTTSECTVSTGSTCTVEVPEEVTTSTGQYGSTYTNVSRSTSSLSAGSLELTANTTFYAYYNSPVTIYYPIATVDSTTGALTNTSVGSYAYYRNEYFSSASAMTAVINSTQTATSNFTFASSATGYSLYGFRTAANSSAKTYDNVAGSATSSSTNLYAIIRKGITATVYYNSGSGNGTLTLSTATATTKYRYIYCGSTTTVKMSNKAYAAPAAVSESVGQYGNKYLGLSQSLSSMTSNLYTSTSSTSTGADTKVLYAIYQGNDVSGTKTDVTVYYYNGTAYTSITAYRNSYFTSVSNSGAMSTVLSTSATGTSNYTTSTGPGGSVWSGLSTAQDTTTEYSTVADAAIGSDLSLYVVYTMNIAYEKGTNTSGIGKTSDSCKLTYDSESCDVTLPSISAPTGYHAVGWSTTKDATTGTAAGQTYSNSSNTTKLYGNVKANDLTFNDKTVSSTFNASTAQTITNGIDQASNGTGTYTYAITGGNSNNYFSVSGRNIVVAKNTPANTTGYSVTITATDSNSGATANATYTIKVNKVNATCTINTTPTLVYPDTATGNITYTCTGDGTISVASSDTNAITVGTVGTTSTPLTAKKVGSSTISVSQAEGANYNAAPAVSSAVNVTGSTYTATFKYYDGTEVATTTSECTVSTGSTCTVEVPEEVTTSTGQYGSTYTNVSRSTSSLSAGSLELTANTTFYAYYNSPVTIYYPIATVDSTTGALTNTSVGSYAYYRNEYFSSASAMTAVINSTQTATSNFTFTPSATGYSLRGFANANTSTRTYSTVSALALSNKATSYAIIRKGITATVYYNSGSGDGTLTMATATTGTGYRNLYCGDTTTFKVTNGNFTAPAAATASVGQYGNKYLGLSQSLSNMTSNLRTSSTSTSTGADTKVLYAIYQGNDVSGTKTDITIYYYNSTSGYTTQTIYRNSYFTSVSGTGAMNTVLSTSTTGTTNGTDNYGPGESLWNGLSTAQDTTTEYATFADAAVGSEVTLYSVYTMNITYEKGTNTSGIGKTSDSCKVTYSDTSCDVTLPSISAPTGYSVVGWSTTKDATTGTAAGQTYSNSSNTTKLYGNVKANVYTITLNKQDGTGGVNSVYEKYGAGYYKESSATTQITTSANAITVPTRTGYTFLGYYTTASGGTKYIEADGKLSSSASATNFTDAGNLYAHWSKAASDLTVTLGTSSYTYDGSAKTPTVTVKDGTTTLSQGTAANGKDYALSYSNNTNAGTAKATITGNNVYNSTTKAFYTGTKDTTFTINKATPIILPSGNYSVYLGDSVLNYPRVKSGTSTTVSGTFTSSISNTDVAELSPTSASVTDADNTTGKSVTQVVSGIAGGSATVTYNFTPTDTTNFNNAETQTVSVISKNIVSIVVKKDNSYWSNSGIEIKLYQNETSKYTLSNLNSAQTLSIIDVAVGTYDVYATKSSLNSTLVDTGIDITITNTDGVISNSIDKEVNYYTLTLNKGSNVTTVTGAGTYLSNQTASINATAFATGYHFGSWTKTSGNTPASLTTASTTVSMSQATTLQATAAINTYSIEFNKNAPSGVTVSGSMSNLSMTYGTAKNLTTNAYSATGYTFIGWNTKADGTGTAYLNGASVNNLTTTNGATVKLYAQWIANGSVSITGVNKVGTQLTATVTSPTPTPTSYTYQWYRGSSTISGATSSTYTPVAADIGSTLKVIVTANYTNYNSATFEDTTDASNNTYAKTQGNMVCTSAVVKVEGSAAKGNALTATVTTAPSPTPTSYTYQWYRGTSAISGATSSTYTLVAADVGQTIKVRVTGVKENYIGCYKEDAIDETNNMSDTVFEVTASDIYYNNANTGVDCTTAKCMIDSLAVITYEKGLAPLSINGIHKYNGNIYYYSNGSKLSGWRKVGGYWYYFDSSNGKAAAIGWTQMNSRWYYFNTDGKMAVGEKQIDGTWYYFYPDNLYQASDIGFMAYNEFINGRWYESNGARKEGVTYSWKNDGNGWWYEGSDGWYPSNESYWIDGKQRHFGGNGYCTNMSD